VNSDRLKAFSCGEDVGVEDGEGGPREEGGTKVWGERAEETGAERVRAGEFVEGEDSRAGEFGGLASLGVRENLLDVVTDNPFSRRAFRRSAIVPPGLLIVPSVRSGVLS